MGKLRKHTTPGVSTLANDIVRRWKEAVDESKRKRKRDDDVKENPDVKRAKPESTASPDQPQASSSRAPSPPRRQPLSTIDPDRKIPRTSKSDKVESTLRAAPDEGDDGPADEVRNKCVALIYDALAADSIAGGWCGGTRTDHRNPDAIRPSSGDRAGGV